MPALGPDLGEALLAPVDLRMLGTLDLSIGGEPIPLGGLRSRIVLAMLALSPDRVVDVVTLVEAIWGGAPPATSRTQVAICVARLRKAFRAKGFDGRLIDTAPPGYSLCTDQVRMDWADFLNLTGAAEAAARQGRQTEAARLMQRALGLWRGKPLAGVPSSLVEAGAAALEERRLAVYERYAAIQLELGGHRELIAELSPVVRDNPLREHARAALMLAYYRSGCRSESLSLFREARQVSIAELGLEPGRDLQELHDAMLQDDPRLASRSYSCVRS
jgi:DNA-binding SARP family transcriptional activator